MTEQQASYRQLLKATSLFGGVQVFNILIAIVRAKFIAIFLGPVGMGIASLLNSTTGIIGGFTNFGLGTSAVKNVAAANETGDEIRVAKVITVLRRLMWATGILGGVITLVLSSWLSQLTFGNKDYTLAFVWLSITLLFNQLAIGQQVALQGLRKLQYLAKAGLAGSVLGLFISVPIYYFWRIKGIVPAIIISSIFLLLINKYFASKVKLENVKPSMQDVLSEGGDMLKMGFMLSLSGLITMTVNYVIRIFVSNSGGLEDVGLYNAGFSIISTYVGLVFSAMSTDYYPRLSALAHDNTKANLLINQQAEVALLILAPIITIFLIFIKWVVILLYSIKFEPVDGMIHWAVMGIYFKATSWSLGFILLAKGASRTFFWSELLSNFYLLASGLIGYKFLGLNGLGISFTLSYILSLIQIYLIARYKYKFSFTHDFYRIFGLQFFYGLLCFSIVKILPSHLAYIVGVPIIGLSTWFSYREMDKRIGLKSLLNKYIRK